MATDRVGIEIELMGYDEAMKHMQNLDSEIKGLKGRQGVLRIKAEIDKLQMNKKALKAQKVRLEADTKDIDKEITKVTNRLKRMRNTLASLRGKNSPFSGVINEKAIKSAEAAVERLQERLRELKLMKADLGGRMGNIQAEINQATSAVQRWQAALKNAGLAGMSLGQIFKNISTMTAHVGSAMQSMGNALTRMTYPVRMFTSGSLMAAGFKALNTIESGLASGFERYDIMKKYDRMMKGFEKGNYTAKKSIDELDKSVQGLPTGLDEMVSLAQRFTMTTGDMKKGTELAIATNNAFLASMATDTQRYQGMMQMQDVLGGKNMNAREWQSLANSMMPAIRMMGESLGKTGKELDQYVTDVQQGKIANEDFIKTLREAGQEGGKIYAMAQQSKDTWQAFTARIGTAFSRMTYGVLESLDEIVKVGTNGKFKSLNTMLDDMVIPTINKLTESAKGWIKAHPEEITDFFSSIKSIDWAGLGRGFVQGIGNVAKGIKLLADKLDGKSLEGVGKLAVYMPMFGSALTIIGGIIKGSRHIVAGIATTAMAIGRGLGAIGAAGAASKITKVVNFIKGLGKVTAAAEAAGAAGAAGGAATGAAAGAVFKGFIPILEIIGGVGAVVTSIAGIAWLDTKILSGAIDNIKNITGGIKDIMTNLKGIKKTEFNKETLRNAVQNLFDAYDIINGETISHKAVGKTMQTTKEKKGLAGMNKGDLKKIADSLEYMNEAFAQMNGIQKNLKGLKKFKGFDQGSVEAVKSFTSQLGDIYEEMIGSFSYTVDEDKASQFAGIIEQSKGMFNSIGEIAGMVPQLQKNLAKGIGSQVGRGTPFERMKSMLTGEQGLFSGIREIYDSISNYLFAEQSGTASQGAKGLTKGAGGKQSTSFTSGSIKKISDAMNNVKSMFTSISGVVKLLPQIQKDFAPMTAQGSGTMGGTALADLKTQLVGLMQKIGEINTAVDTNIGDTSGMVTKMEGLKSAISAIKSAVSTLKGLGSGALASTDTGTFVAIDNIKAMVTRLGQALNTEMLGSLRMQVANFKAAIDEIFATLNTDLSSVEVTVQIDGDVTGDDELVADIKAADSAIRRAVASIKTNYYKTISITLHRSVSVTGTDPSTVNVGGGDFWHTGGYIGSKIAYRKSGGGIGDIFKPKGTDTVPAMLTPGEYVQRKAAVDYFGVKFMQKINRLDVAGAFRELSARVGGSVIGRGGTTIYNNITNNNSPTINQTVNTRNPNFAFKRSNRFVAAL